MNKEICICGHDKSAHSNYNGRCCIRKKSEYCSCKKFKAKEKEK